MNDGEKQLSKGKWILLERRELRRYSHSVDLVSISKDSKVILLVDECFTPRFACQQRKRSWRVRIWSMKNVMSSSGMKSSSVFDVSQIDWFKWNYFLREFEEKYRKLSNVALFIERLNCTECSMQFSVWLTNNRD